MITVENMLDQLERLGINVGKAVYRVCAALNSGVEVITMHDGKAVKLSLQNDTVTVEQATTGITADLMISDECAD